MEEGGWVRDLMTGGRTTWWVPCSSLWSSAQPWDGCQRNLQPEPPTGIDLKNPTPRKVYLLWLKYWGRASPIGTWWGAALPAQQPGSQQAFWSVSSSDSIQVTPAPPQLGPWAIHLPTAVRLLPSQAWVHSPVLSKASLLTGLWWREVQCLLQGPSKESR